MPITTITLSFHYLLRVVLVLLFIPLFSITADAQRRNKKAREEVVLPSCDIPREERNIVAVRSFRTTARSRNVGSVGTGMADMLTNALVNSDCFRVVDRQTLDDILDEQDFTSGGRVSRESSAKLGELTGAQLLISGNITEFKENEGGGAILGKLPKLPIGGLGMITAHVGFIIQIIDVNTGEIMVSKSIERKKSKVGALGGGGGRGWIGGAAFFKSQAMADALEEAIIEAVDLLAQEREDLPAPREIKKLEGRLSDVIIEGMDYTSFRKVAGVAEAISGVVSVKKSVEDGNGVLNVRHTCPLEDILDGLLDGSGLGFEVLEMGDGLIQLRLK